MWAFTAIRWVSSWSLHNFPYVSFYVRPPTICHRWNRRCVRLAKPPFYGYGLYNKRNQTGIKFNELRELSLNLPLSARNFEPTGNSGFFLFGMSFIPVDTVQGYIWSSSCHLSGYLLTPGTVPTWRPIALYFISAFLCLTICNHWLVNAKSDVLWMVWTAVVPVPRQCNKFLLLIF